ncbi:MAG: YIP1 family protein, partial [Candidatus Angelobacter sp.]
AMQASITKVTFFIFPVFALIGGVVIAAVLMAVFNFGFAAEVPFDKSLAIVFYSFLPSVITAVLMILTLLVSSDLSSFNIKNPVATNPAFFMDPLGNSFLYSIASRLDIISIWVLVLMGLGFATVSKKKLAPATAIITMCVVYGLYALAAAGLASAF